MFSFSYICCYRTITENMKVFICDCLFDTAFYLRNNFDDYIFFQITTIPRPYIFLFNENENDRVFICCKQTIDFFIKYDEKYYNSCMAKCYHEFIDPNSCNCLDLSCFGFEDFCIECYKITIDILFKVLNQIENVEISPTAFSD